MSNTETATAPRICDECEADETTEQHLTWCRYSPDAEPDVDEDDDSDEYDAREWREYLEEMQSNYDDFYGPDLSEQFPNRADY